MKLGGNVTIYLILAAVQGLPRITEMGWSPKSDPAKH